MSQIPEPLDTNPAFILGSGGEMIQPIEHRNGLGILLIEDNRNLGHDRFLDVRIIANIDQGADSVNLKIRYVIPGGLSRFENPCNVADTEITPPGSALREYKSKRRGGCQER